MPFLSVLLLQNIWHLSGIKQIKVLRYFATSFFDTNGFQTLMCKKESVFTDYAMLRNTWMVSCLSLTQIRYQHIYTT